VAQGRAKKDLESRCWKCWR